MNGADGCFGLHLNGAFNEEMDLSITLGSLFHQSIPDISMVTLTNFNENQTEPETLSCCSLENHNLGWWQEITEEIKPHTHEEKIKTKLKDSLRQILKKNSKKYLFQILKDKILRLTKEVSSSVYKTHGAYLRLLGQPSKLSKETIIESIIELIFDYFK